MNRQLSPETTVEIESKQPEVIAAEDIVEATAIEEEKTVALALDTETTTPAPKKKGFFSRLFASPEPETDDATANNLSVESTEPDSTIVDVADVTEEDEVVITEPETQPETEAEPIVSVESVASIKP